MFFDEAVTAAVYRRSPYSAHGQRDTDNGEDQIYAQAGRSRARLRLKLTRRGQGYRGTIALGVAT